MNQPITFTFVPEQVITWMIIGLIAGLLANLVVRGRGYGLVGNVVVGLLGALLGGFLFTILHIELPPGFSGAITLRLSDIVVAFFGALIILILFGALYRYRRPLV